MKSASLADEVEPDGHSHVTGHPRLSGLATSRASRPSAGAGLSLPPSQRSPSLAIVSVRCRWLSA